MTSGANYENPRTGANKLELAIVSNDAYLPDSQFTLKNVVLKWPQSTNTLHKQQTRNRNENETKKDARADRVE